MDSDLQDWQKPTYPVNDLLVLEVEDHVFPAIKFLSNEDVINHANKYDVMDIIAKTSQLKEKMEFALEQTKKEDISNRVTHKDLKTTLAAIVKFRIDKEYITKQEGMRVDFKLSHKILCSTTIPPPEYVRVWIGSSVLMKLSIAEAEKLITEQITHVERKMEESMKSIEFIRDNIVHLEVNHSRFNFLWESRVAVVKRELYLEKMKEMSAVSN
eukprot:GHVH01012046.1.p1 GENE.GHVH01012046.1~~GHVH01012046.1.p1  ORF type:complete len:213 (+),score=42.17 GHVH01012046.1:43-681(+)